MPNDCWNLITLKATTDQIIAILETEFQSTPTWAAQLIRIGKGALQFKLWSAWAPNKEFTTRLYDTYPGIWIKNEWNEEGGHAGVIVGHKEDVKELQWYEGCIEEWSDSWMLQTALSAPIFRRD